MARTRILLDTNAYIRLARSVHPLLDQEFGGSARYCLYVINELMQELKNSPRLSSKFAWVNQSQYRDNRKRPLTMSGAKRKEIEQVFGYIEAHVRDENIPTSRTDNRAIATAYTLQISLVTDDAQMRRLAALYGVETLTTLELVKIMVESNHIDIDWVRQIVAYWKADADLPTPSTFKDEYVRLFGESPPAS